MSDAANAPTVTLHKGAPNGTKVADFTVPSNYPANGWLEYTPTEAIVLHSGMTYWMLATGDSNSGLVREANNVDTDSGAADVWSIFGRARYRPGGSRSSESYSDDYAYKLAVRAIPVIHDLVGNTGQLRDDYRQTISFDLEQRFTTGPNTNGYNLKEIHLLMAVTTAPTVTLRAKSDGSVTGAKIADLVGPDSYGSGEQTYVFTPSAAVTLTAIIEYSVRTQGGDANWVITRRLGDDTGGHTGFSIDDPDFRNPGTMEECVTGQEYPHKMQLRGEVVPETSPNLVANSRQSEGPFRHQLQLQRHSPGNQCARAIRSSGRRPHRRGVAAPQGRRRRGRSKRVVLGGRPDLTIELSVADRSDGTRDGREHRLGRRPHHVRSRFPGHPGQLHELLRVGPERRDGNAGHHIHRRGR